MGIREWLGFGSRDVAEAEHTPVPLPERRGYDPGVPIGGADEYQPGGNYPDSRGEFMQRLYEAYLACPWASAAIDATARTTTAGGLKLVPDVDDTDPAHRNPPEQMPSSVQALADLLAFCNPDQDIRQILRGIVVDLEVFGDAFLEVSWLLKLPVAVYSLDSATMIIETDDHGQVTGYKQLVDIRTATFEPHEVIHISADQLRGGPYGTGALQKALLPITTWLFTSAVLKERMRRGDPPDVFFDFTLEQTPTDIERWRQQYRKRNLGPANIGNPITAKSGDRGIKVHEFRRGRLLEYLDILDQARDAIVSNLGVPPAKVGIIESGNLGGGTGTSQDKTFRVNKCGPLAAIVLEKLNFALLAAFDIADWVLVIPDVDWRDDQVVEQIRDLRLRNGAWTLNDYLTEIGKPSIGPEGDVHVLVDRQNLVAWSDLVQYSAASVAALAAKGAAAAAPGESDDIDGFGEAAWPTNWRTLAASMLAEAQSSSRRRWSAGNSRRRSTSTSEASQD